MKKIKVFIKILVLFVSFSFLTGCQSNEEKMVDEFYEQLEYDIKIFFNNYEEIIGLSENQKSNKKEMIKEFSETIKNAKKEMKEKVKYMKENISDEDLKYYAGKTIEETIEIVLSKERLEIEKQLEASTNGKVKLQYSKINRGFFGSIIYFSKKNWILLLIIIGILGYLLENLESLYLKIKNDENK